jgi:hypothetical protein
MAALFPWWANSIARASLLVLVTLLIVVPLGLMVWVRSSFATGQHADVRQPIPFDHRVHAGALHIDCRFCHSTVEIAAPAGLPPSTTCVNCHSKGLRESSLFAPVRNSIETGRAIAWNRVNALPDFVFFNHSIHVAKGVGCETCHGRVDRMSQASQAAPLTMQWCVSCHRDPSPHLRPTTEIATMGWHPDSASDVALAQASLAREHRVRSLTSCSTCHR